jgi:uncharacterized membrane protein
VLAVFVDRPDAWNFPLLLHVLGAMLLVGSLLLASLTLIGAWRSGSPALVRSGARVLFLGVLPSYLLMRLTAEWIADKEGWNDVDSPPSWIDVGYLTGDLGALLIIITMICAGLAVRRLNRGAAGPSVSVRIATGLLSFLVVAYLVAIWAMTTKPS